VSGNTIVGWLHPGSTDSKHTKYKIMRLRRLSRFQDVSTRERTVQNLGVPPSKNFGSLNFFLLCLQIWPSLRGRKENLFQFRNAGSIGNRGEDHHNYFYIRQFLRIVLILVSSRVHEVFSAERICGRHVIQTQTGKPLNFYCLVLVHWACDACPKKNSSFQSTPKSENWAQYKRKSSSLL